MADQIGVAVENINLFEEVKNKTTDLETSNAELRGDSGAPNRNVRSARHHQPVTDGRAAGARRYCRERGPSLWYR